MLPGVGVEVSAFVRVEWAEGDVGGVFACKLVVFPAEVEELGTVSKAKVGGGGVACCVECEVKNVEVNEPEGDVGGGLVQNEVVEESVARGIAWGNAEVVVG